MSVKGQYQAVKKLVDAICAGEGITEVDALELLTTGRNDAMLETGRNPLYAYLPELSTFREEITQASSSLIVATKQEAKDLVLVRHPGQWVQVSDASKGYFIVQVKESEHGTAIASYSVKTW